MDQVDGCLLARFLWFLLSSLVFISSTTFRNYPDLPSEWLIDKGLQRGLNESMVSFVSRRYMRVINGSLMAHA